MKLKKITLNINGADRTFVCDPEKDSLADVLRRMGLTGTKVGCNIGVCGACSVLLNGNVIRSCTKKIRTIHEFSTVITIEGIGTPRNLHPLQVAWMNYGAVQCGFCSPGFIVSAYGLLIENNNPAREDVRDWFQKHRNVCRCTGYKPLVDAVMEAAKVVRGEATIEDIIFKLPKDKEYYGKPLVRPAALAKVCGLADYGDDVELKMPAETLHVAVVQPKIVHHAKILNIDFAEAEKMTGVVKIITYKDVKGTNHLNLFRTSKRCTVIEPEHPILCEDTIYNYGDVVALVVADTKDHARAAAAKVNVEIEPLPEYLNYLDAVMPDAMRVHKDTQNIFSMQPVLKGLENVEEVIDNSVYSVEGSFYSTREPHLSIEGDTVQAYFDEDDMLTVQCKTQGCYFSAFHIASAVGIDAKKVRVVENPAGGTFGWSISAASFALAAIATVTTKMPVALSMSYEEHMHFSGKRCPSYSNGRLACDKSGKITAVEFDFGLDHGAYSESGDDILTRVVRFVGFPYNIPNIAGLARVATTNSAFGVAYRSYGSPQAYTLSESLVDMLAEKAGIDPFEFRLLNIAHPGDTNTNSYPFHEYPMEEMMEKMSPLYEKAVAEAKAADIPEVHRGVGIAWGGYNVSSSSVDNCTVALELNSDNTFTKYDTWQDVGQGGDIGSLMVTLEALKPLRVTPDKIRLVENDTKYCPNSGLSAGSRSHYMNGNAVTLAAQMLMDAMRKPDGTYRTYDEMVVESLQTKYEANYSNTAFSGLCAIDPNTGVGNPSPAYTYALFMAEVEVGIATGKTKVLRFTCVDDVGTIGNIDAVNGQAYGGISHSIGFALKENYDDVKKHTNIYACGVPYAKDIPDEINVIHCQNKREGGPWGSSGASEAFQSSGHMAVINAIHNACGVRIYELPVTPEKVKAGLDIIAAGGKIQPPCKFYLGSDLYEELEKIKANPV